MQATRSRSNKKQGSEGSEGSEDTQCSMIKSMQRRLSCRLILWLLLFALLGFVVRWLLLTTSAVEIQEVPLAIGDHGVSVPLTFSSDGRYLACGDAVDSRLQKGVDIWDLHAKTATRLRETEDPRNARASRILFSNNNELLAVDDGQHGLTIWNIRDKTILCKFYYLESYYLTCMAFSTDDQTLCVGLTADDPLLDGAAPRDLSPIVFTIHEVSSGRPRSRIPINAYKKIQTLNRSGESAILVKVDGTRVLFDMVKMQEVTPFEPKAEVAFSADGGSLVSISSNTISVRAATSGDETKRFETIEEGSSHITRTVATNGCAVLAYQTDSNHNMVNIFQMQSGKKITSLRVGEPGSICESLAISPDGHFIAAMTGSVSTNDKIVKPQFKLWSIPKDLRGLPILGR